MKTYDINSIPDKVFVHLDDKTPFAERDAWTAAFLHVVVTHMNNYGGNPDVMTMAIRTFASAYMNTTEENEKIVYDALMKKLYEGEPVAVPDNKNFYRRQIEALEKIIRERGLWNLYDMRVYEACVGLVYPGEPDSPRVMLRLEPDKSYAD